MQKKKRNNILRISSAYLLIVLGIIGSILPILPGIPTLLVGIYLLHPKKFKAWFHKLKSKLSPRHQQQVQKLLEKFKRKK